MKLSLGQYVVLVTALWAWCAMRRQIGEREKLVREYDGLIQQLQEMEKQNQTHLDELNSLGTEEAQHGSND